MLTLIINNFSLFCSCCCFGLYSQKQTHWIYKENRLGRYRTINQMGEKEREKQEFYRGIQNEQ